MRIAIATLAVLLLGACTQVPETVHETRFMMGTLVDFTVLDINKDRASISIRAAAEEMQRVEKLFTIYGSADNPVKQFNATPPGHPFEFPEEISALLETSQEINAASGGAFSVTLGALNKLWGFSMEVPPESPPDEKNIAHLKASSGHCLTHLSGRLWQRSNVHCQLDFGAIAKGYAIDRGMQVLKSGGIANAIINAGGDVRVTGRHGDRPWKVGLRHPRQPGEVIATLQVEGDVSIVTSGDYERTYVFDGMRYHHILDPDTGMPARKSQSATIIADNATMADGWSTALFVMGKAGLEAVEKRDMEGFLVAADGSVHKTGNIDTRLQLTPMNPMLRTSAIHE